MLNEHLSTVREKHGSMVSIVKKLALKKINDHCFHPRPTAENWADVEYQMTGSEIWE